MESWRATTDSYAMPLIQGSIKGNLNTELKDMPIDLIDTLLKEWYLCCSKKTDYDQASIQVAKIADKVANNLGI